MFNMPYGKVRSFQKLPQNCHTSLTSYYYFVSNLNIYGSLGSEIQKMQKKMSF